MPRNAGMVKRALLVFWGKLRCKASERKRLCKIDEKDWRGSLNDLRAFATIESDDFILDPVQDTTL